jgi:hypothetical protein
MLPDEMSETLKRTEALAVQSALALCLAFELMERCKSRLPKEADNGFGDIRDQVRRVGEALETVLQIAHADEELGEGLRLVQRAPSLHRRLN